MNVEIQEFLEGLEADMAANPSTLEQFGVGSQRIQAGYKGTIARVGFVQLDEASGATALTRPQRIGGRVVAETGEFPIVYNLIMEDGRSISANTLKQSPMSTIKIGSDKRKAIALLTDDWAALVGGSFEVLDSDDDTKTTIRRRNVDNDNKLEDRKARFFTCEVTGVTFVDRSAEAKPDKKAATTKK